MQIEILKPDFKKDSPIPMEKQINDYLCNLANTLNIILSQIDTDNLSGNLLGRLGKGASETESIVEDTTSDMRSEIKQNADSIALKVSKGEVISEINLSSEEARINADKIKLEGYTTINDNFSVDTNGNAHLKDAVIEINATDGIRPFVTNIDNQGIIIRDTSNYSNVKLTANAIQIQYAPANSFITITGSGMSVTYGGALIFGIDGNGVSIYRGNNIVASSSTYASLDVNGKSITSYVSGGYIETRSGYICVILTDSLGNEVAELPIRSV